MKITAKLNNLRISPRKVRLVTDFIKGMDTNNALVQLSYTVKGSSREVIKLLKSAIANAENNFGMDRDNLIISDIQVGEGPILKRWLPRAHGRATQLLKRTSNIYMTLSEKIEGKGRKAKGNLKKADKQEETKEDGKNEAKEMKKISAEKIIPEKKISTKGQKGGFSKKSFQRKSI